ncbi:MAG: nucleotidyltransferase family protein [Thermoguttaceae bacterium]|jgi:molybdenum cofactor cytidylyltransferase|nr:nucleotidyltransferase family protein [Thermoguttaceae bacterium]
MIGAIVLAAGQSRRMGTQKLLLPLGGQPVIVRVVDEVLRSSVRPVLVVVGDEGQKIVAALSGRRVTPIENADPHGDMLGSVRCGLAALPEACEAALVVLGDQPGVAADVIERLCEAFRAQARGIVVPACRGRRGHPLLVASRYRQEVLTHYEGIGLRGLLAAHPDDVFEVEVDSPKAFDDLDTPEDYQRILRAEGDL